MKQLRLKKQTFDSFVFKNWFLTRFANIFLMRFAICMSLHVVLVAEMDIADLAPVKINSRLYVYHIRTDAMANPPVGTFSGMDELVLPQSGALIESF